MNTSRLTLVPSIIGGEIAQVVGESLAIIDPATREEIGRVGVANAAMVNDAVRAAKAAFPGWRATPPAQRARYLMRFREIIERERNALAALITSEHGKPTIDALGSIQRGIEVVEFATGAPQLLKGEYSDHVATGVATRSSRRPLGVCVGITPYNYPAMIPMWMFPVAIACGNTFVLKPSEKTPSAANSLAMMLAEAGVPKGVLNVVHGGRDVVEALSTHPDVAAVSFVGSSAVARTVYETGTCHGKRVQALGGAKNHAIVLPDADLETTVDSVLSGAFNSAGQRCMAIAVVVTVGCAHDAFISRLLEKAATLKVAPGSDPTCYVPPVSTAAQFERIKRYIALGEQEGARLRLDGRKDCGAGKGFFMGPVIFDQVLPHMTIYLEEIFGPVLSVVKVNTLDEAIQLSNQHPLGNGAVLFTSSAKAAQQFEDEVLCGMPGVNVPVPSPVAYYSFGGSKKSIYGDLAVHGPDSINFYTRRQVLTSRWP